MNDCVYFCANVFRRKFAQRLGSILADSANRGKKELCQAVILRAAPSAIAEVLNWEGPQV